VITVKNIDCVLVCDTVESVGNLLNFRRNLVCPYSQGGSSFPETLVNCYQNSRCHTAMIAFSGKFCCNDVSNTGVV
jgi:hypothetical protein